ncbi:CPBP family intramembrane glutamic endopeptidase [Lacticaseibacillus hulanensis]|uniref:CPBP family intramembrane glutamic endopeptidase n=1 Tax=Lacticaseibacillus hulanensis TaxID=2493111 RepID=UPI0013E3211A|nr:type II CAAX endopeptidase family protein [Lacticaseibacillus hulanensis]
MRRKHYIWNRVGALAVFGLSVLTLYFYQLPMLVISLVVRRKFPHSHAARLAELGRLDPWIALATLVFALVQIGLLYWLYRHQLKKRNPLHIQRKKFRLESLFFLFLMYALVLAANVAVQQFGTPANQEGVMAEMKILPLTLFLLAGVLAPFIEELIFRGIFMNVFWQKDNQVNSICAILISGLVFGLMHEPHLSVFLLLYSSLGWILAYTYRYHRDLRYSIGLHMMINFPSALVALLQAL